VVISAVLIVRNEEDCLEGCLKSVSNVADEVVVVDTGSEDGTIAVARSLTDRVYGFTWRDDFSAARNAALEHAAGDYVLHVDADERVVQPDSARGLLEAFAVNRGPAVVGTVAVRSPIWTGREPLEAIDHIPRFFKRGSFLYQGAIHEQITPISGEMTIAPTGLELFHTGYAHGPDSPKDKSSRNRRLLRKELEKCPGDAYCLYQFGKTHFAVKEYGEAAPFFEQALESLRLDCAARVPCPQGGTAAPPFLSDLVVSLAYCYANTARATEARDLLERHKTRGHTGARDPDLHHALGYVYLMLGDVARSRAAYFDSLRAGPSQERVVGTGSFASHYHLGLLCESERDLDGALEHYAVSLRIKPDYRASLARCIDMIGEYGVPLPAEVWDVCDQAPFSALFLDKLSTLLREGAQEDAHRLVHAARDVSENLYRRCEKSLGEFNGGGSQGQTEKGAPCD